MHTEAELARARERGGAASAKVNTLAVAPARRIRGKKNDALKTRGATGYCYTCKATHRWEEPHVG